MTHKACTATESQVDRFHEQGGETPVGKWIKKAVRLHQTCDRCKRDQFHGCRECLAEHAARGHFMNKRKTSSENGMDPGGTYVVSKWRKCVFRMVR